MIFASELSEKEIEKLNESRENWKEKAQTRQQKLRSIGIKVRDLEKSREKWKIRAKQNQKRIKELEEENKRLKRGKQEMIISEKPPYHQYSLSQISLSINQVIISGNSFRGVSKNWQISVEHYGLGKLGFNTFQLPSYSAIRTWWTRLGLYELQREKEKRYNFSIR